MSTQTYIEDSLLDTAFQSLLEAIEKMIALKGLARHSFQGDNLRNEGGVDILKELDCEYFLTDFFGQATGASLLAIEQGQKKTLLPTSLQRSPSLSGDLMDGYFLELDNILSAAFTSSLSNNSSQDIFGGVPQKLTREDASQHLEKVISIMRRPTVKMETLKLNDNNLLHFLVAIELADNEAE